MVEQPALILFVSDDQPNNECCHGIFAALLSRQRTGRGQRVDTSLLAGEASGELAGTGVWHLTSEGATTLVRYDWQVDTTKPWMKILEPIGIRSSGKS